MTETQQTHWLDTLVSEYQEKIEVLRSEYELIGSTVRGIIENQEKLDFILEKIKIYNQVIEDLNIQRLKRKMLLEKLSHEKQLKVKKYFIPLDHNRRIIDTPQKYISAIVSRLSENIYEKMKEEKINVINVSGIELIVTIIDDETVKDLLG